jgi:hypothetical protein
MVDQALLAYRQINRIQFFASHCVFKNLECYRSVFASFYLEAKKCFSSFLTQGCQMVYFHTKNPNLGIFRRALDWNFLMYVMAIWNILRTFGIFYDHLVHFVFIWYISSGSGVTHQEKSGNPALTIN